MILFMCHHSILGGGGYLYLDLTEKTEHDPEKLDFELHVVTGNNFPLGKGEYVLGWQEEGTWMAKVERPRQRLRVFCQISFFLGKG